MSAAASSGRCPACSTRRRPSGRTGSRSAVKRLGIWREVDWQTLADRRPRDGACARRDRHRRRATASRCSRPTTRAGSTPISGSRPLGARSRSAIYAAQDADELPRPIAAAAPDRSSAATRSSSTTCSRSGSRSPAFERIVVFDMKGLHAPEYARRADRLVRGLPGRRPRPARGGARTATPSCSPRYGPTTSRSSPSPRHDRPRPPASCSRQRGQVALGRLLAARIGARPDDRGFSLLPLGHATARVFDVVAPLVAGSSINFAESPQTIEGDLAELSPTRLRRDAEVLRADPGRGRAARRPGGPSEAPRVRVRACAASPRRSRRAAAAAARGSPPSSAARSSAASCSTRRACSACATPASAGRRSRPTSSTGTGRSACPVREQYGQVETGGIAFAQRGVEDAGTAGVPLGPAIEARLGPGGELSLRSPGLHVGRFGEAAGGAPDDGWYATGDLVRLDEQGRAGAARPALTAADDHRRRGRLARCSRGRPRARRATSRRRSSSPRDGRSSVRCSSCSSRRSATGRGPARSRSRPTRPSPPTATCSG